ncbi:hypothetical protein [Paracoccus sp. (in: a-proteobacteria)]|uniref:hypothetical protein n=1 Tax=Paracoccus sp. TaxID=267 RepID=UPI00396CF998
MARPGILNMRRLRHPGPVLSPRVQTVDCRAHPVSLILRAGRTVADAVASALAAAGYEAGYLRLDGLEMTHLAYVIPAAAPGDGRVAWYSDTRTKAPCRIEAGGIHLGLRDGQPFCHGHGLWRDQCGQLAAGHLRADESVIGQDCTITGWGLTGAHLEVHDDPETRFPVFALHAAKALPQGRRAHLCRIRPNEDLVTVLDEMKLPDGAVIEGLGSLVGAGFSDGSTLNCDAAEILIVNGRLCRGRVALQVVATGDDGTVAQGDLAKGLNAVCITAELLIVT